MTVQCVVCAFFESLSVHASVSKKPQAMTHFLSLPETKECHEDMPKHRSQAKNRTRMCHSLSLRSILDLPLGFHVSHCLRDISAQSKPQINQLGPAHPPVHMRH